MSLPIDNNRFLLYLYRVNKAITIKTHKTMTRFNRSEIMKSAWAIVRNAGKTISSALKLAWANVKNAMNNLPLINTLEKSTALDLLNYARVAMKEAGLKVAAYYDSKKSIEDAAAQGVSVEITQDNEFSLYGIFANGSFIWGQVFNAITDKCAPALGSPVKNTDTWEVAAYNEMKKEF